MRTPLGQVYVVFFLLWTSSASGQNLVQNPSFERTKIIDARWCPSAEDFDERMHVWTSPTQGSPDILFDKLLNRMWPHRPFVSMDKSAPRTGRLMVSIRVYGCENRSVHCKEYIQVPLKTPLQPGREYLVEYWVLPIINSFRVNKLGMAFTRGQFQQRFTREVISLTPVYESDTIVGGGTGEWVPVSCRYVPETAVTHLTIGVFAEDEEMLVKYPAVPYPLGYAFYLVDDVSVVELSETNVDILESPESPSGLPEALGVVLSDAFFEFDDHTLTREGEQRLDGLLDSIAMDRIEEVRISGHTDSIGTEQYNQLLSERRAFAVEKVLLARGVPGDLMSTVGYGFRKPVGADPAANRRVELVIILR